MKLEKLIIPLIRILPVALKDIGKEECKTEIRLYSEKFVQSQYDSNPGGKSYPMVNMIDLFK